MLKKALNNEICDLYKGIDQKNVQIFSHFTPTSTPPLVFAIFFEFYKKKFAYFAAN